MFKKNLSIRIFGGIGLISLLAFLISVTGYYCLVQIAEKITPSKEIADMLSVYKNLMIAGGILSIVFGTLFSLLNYRQIYIYVRAAIDELTKSSQIIHSSFVKLTNSSRLIDKENVHQQGKRTKQCGQDKCQPFSPRPVHGCFAPTTGRGHLLEHLGGGCIAHHRRRRGRTKSPLGHRGF